MLAGTYYMSDGCMGIGLWGRECWGSMMRKWTEAILPLSYVSQRVQCNVAWHMQLLQDAGAQACVVMHNTKNESITALSLPVCQPTRVTIAHLAGRAGRASLAKGITKEAKRCGHHSK